MTSPILFTSDLHFLHNNILAYCKRPFKDTDHMNEELIKNYNSKANGKTLGFIAGDIVFKGGGLSECKKLIDRLNGTKVLILGNHDKKLIPFKRRTPEECYDTTGFIEVTDYKEVKYTFKDGEEKEFMIFHYPMVTWNKKRYGSVHLFGHVHNQIANPIPGSMDIGVDANDYFPVSPEDIRVKLRAKGQWTDLASEL